MITAKIRKTKCTGYSIPIYHDSEYIGMIWGDEYTVQSGIITGYYIQTHIDGDLAGVMHVNDYVCLTWQEPLG